MASCHAMNVSSVLMWTKLVSPKLHSIHGQGPGLDIEIIFVKNKTIYLYLASEIETWLNQNKDMWIKYDDDHWLVV